LKLALIVAMAQNRVIGINNNLPWYLPNDLKYFKAVTMGKPVIMGRKTHESIGKPLPGRTNIVITRDASFQAAGCKIVHSLAEAIELAENICLIDGGDEVIVMGGAQIYELALADADRLYLTEVHAEIEGDAFFPEVDKQYWQEVAREDYKAEGPNPYAYSFLALDRKGEE
jgi:dihydrofolate reductase